MHHTAESISLSHTPQCASYCRVNLRGVHHTIKHTAESIVKIFRENTQYLKISAVYITPRRQSPRCVFTKKMCWTPRRAAQCTPWRQLCDRIYRRNLNQILKHLGLFIRRPRWIENLVTHPLKQIQT